MEARLGQWHMPGRVLAEGRTAVRRGQVNHDVRVGMQGGGRGRLRYTLRGWMSCAAIWMSRPPKPLGVLDWDLARVTAGRLLDGLCKAQRR